ncbi:peptide deformylase, mitochondrial-like [Coccinella septempunctata]|uniref:peptide deformylase, mitochondrial-like n=1 Tax=Coccinella septempunctata TaxID=41139 RepID=UPI001D090EC8|nr:peptide deformylase, mitochondrial-like [Coccinella septempunctata]
MKLKTILTLLNQPNSQVRHFSYKNVLTWYSSLVKPKPPTPPYKHITQIGDPCLRLISKPVTPEAIETEEIQKLIAYLKHVCRKYDCHGLSAPQIGVPLRIFTIGLTQKALKTDFTEKEIAIKNIQAIEPLVVINPEMKISDYKTVVLEESCESIKGFQADVPRYLSLELTGLDEFGENISMNAKGFTARIIQHEMDHLDGKLYTDIMNKKTLCCPNWQIVNERCGKVELPYGPYK